MTNLVIDYAVDIDRQTAAPAASTDFLKRLGVFVTRGANFPEDPENPGNYDPGITVVKCTKYNEPDQGVFDVNDAKLYTDDLGIQSIISKLGSVYLIFTRAPSEVASAADSEFYTITHSAEACREVADCVSVAGASISAEAVFVVSDHAEEQSGGFNTALENGKVVFDTNQYDPLLSDPKFYSTDMQISAICSLLGQSNWRNQQYEPMSVFDTLTSSDLVENASVTNRGDAESLFSSNTSFFLWNSEIEAAYLGFFVTKTGASITTPYVRKEFEIACQNMFVSYVSLNESYNTITARKTLQQGVNKLIKRYLDSGIFDADGENRASVTVSSKKFYVNGDIYITNAPALWRAAFTAYYGESPISADGTTIS